MKTLIIDAICGIGFPSIVLALECEKVGLAEYRGNQHNPDWLWRRDRLEKVDLDKLQELYQGLREEREAWYEEGEEVAEPAQSRIITCQ